MFAGIKHRLTLLDYCNRQFHNGQLHNFSTTETESTIGKVVFSITDPWPKGFIGHFQLTNTTSQKINNWTLEFLLDDDITIDSVWNGKFNKLTKK